MKKLLGLTLLTVFLVGMSPAVNAQSMKRSEKKKIKKELRKYKRKPETYKKMITAKNKTIQEQESIIEELNNEIIELRKQNRSMKDSLSLFESRLAALMKKYEDATSGPELPDGTVYQVQIGYYKKLNLKAFNKRLKYVKAEQQSGGKRYVIGYFTDLNSAKSFNSDLRKLGVKDAFVTQYIDGTRNMDFDANK